MDFPATYALRLRFRCSKDPRHMDYLILGTPVLLSFVQGLPAECPLCKKPVEISIPPEEIDIKDDEVKR